MAERAAAMEGLYHQTNKCVRRRGVGGCQGPEPPRGGRRRARPPRSALRGCGGRAGGRTACLRPSALAAPFKGFSLIRVLLFHRGGLPVRFVLQLGSEGKAWPCGLAVCLSGVPACFSHVSPKASKARSPRDFKARDCKYSLQTRDSVSLDAQTFKAY